MSIALAAFCHSASYKSPCWTTSPTWGREDDILRDSLIGEILHLALIDLRARRLRVA